jgi:hypothetical protein
LTNHHPFQEWVDVILEPSHPPAVAASADALHRDVRLTVEPLSLRIELSFLRDTAGGDERDEIPK